MNVLNNIAQAFDRKAFLSYRLWEFSLKNLWRLFPFYFLFRLVIAHPIRSLSGLASYFRLVKQSKNRPLMGTVPLSEIFSYSVFSNSRQLMIAPGFCMKPYNNEKNRSLCPAGQFNHNCSVFEKPDLIGTSQEEWPFPCNGCNIGTLVRYAADLNARFYIMTSAIDIARDLFLPALKSSRPLYGIYMLCPYSREPFSFGLSICGIKGTLLTFCQGECRDHEEWTNADIGIKQEQTFLKEQEFLSLLHQLKEISRLSKIQTFKYKQVAHVYYPQ